MLPHTCSHIFPQDGSTALIWASKNGFLDVVKALIQHGADANAVNNVSMFPSITHNDILSHDGFFTRT